MDTFFTCLLILILAFFVHTIRTVWWLKKLPPGPWGLPILGSIIHLNRNNAIDEIQKYKRKYGPICSIGIGNFNVIVISDLKLIQEAFKLDALNGRPDLEMFHSANGGLGFRNRGILFCDANETWNEQRRFALKQFKEFGFGRSAMESLILDEVGHLVQFFKDKEGESLSLRTVFSAAVLNSLWMILTSHRFQWDDPVFERLITMLSTAVKTGRLTGVGVFFVAAAKLLKGDVWRQAVQMRVDMLELMKQEVKEHENTYRDGAARDFVDAYLRERKDGNLDPKSSLHAEEGLMNLVVVLKDMFVAGAETTSTTLLWAVLYLTQNQGIQEKVQQEIDTVIGNNRLPVRDDRNKLVYMEAFLNEVHRMCSLVPMTLYHAVQQDTVFAGYFFPKKAVVFANLHGIHHDKNYWKDPEIFRPERFLDVNGKQLVKHSHFMPFSTGKRLCLGENLARDTIFLILTSILQRYTIELDTESYDKDPAIVEKPSFVQTPGDFNVIVKRR